VAADRHLRRSERDRAGHRVPALTLCQTRHAARRVPAGRGSMVLVAPGNPYREPPAASLPGSPHSRPQPNGQRSPWPPTALRACMTVSALMRSGPVGHGSGHPTSAIHSAPEQGRGPCRRGSQGPRSAELLDRRPGSGLEAQSLPPGREAIQDLDGVPRPKAACTGLIQLEQAIDIHDVP